MSDIDVVVPVIDREAKAPTGLPVRIHELDALHLAQGRSLQDVHQAGAQQAELPGGELAEILDRGGVAGGRSNATSVEWLDEVAGTIALQGSVADSQALSIEILGMKVRVSLRPSGVRTLALA